MIDPAEATAILLTGSYAKGTAVPGSDFDLVAVTPKPCVPYRGWFEERDGGPPLKVEADSWEAKAASPARWALRGSFGLG
jgi:predicted nucleotidyltransferase